MRTPAPLKLSLASLAIAAAVSACSDARATTDADADLQRDLALASSTVSLAAPQVDSSLLNAMETRPNGAPEQASVVKKGAGSRAVRSQTPTVRATPVEELAASESEEEVAEVMAEAPAPEESEPVAIAPRPQPVVVDAGGAGDYGTGNGGVYGGGIGGIIIRGGGIDGDNCELHRRGRGGVARGPIFIPQQPIPQAGGTVVNLPRPSGRGGIGSRGSAGRVTGVADRSPGSSRGTGGRMSSPRGR